MLLTIVANNDFDEDIMEGNGGDKVASEGSRTLVSLAERVAIVETKVGSLKDDTGVIRSTIHDINNRMQEFVAAEIRCGDSLQQLLPLRSLIDRLAEDNQRGKGIWRGIGIVGTTLLGGATVGAIIASGLWWILHGH